MIKEIANHRSIRKYKSSPIDEEVLSDILHSAARASTCGNMQLYSLVVTLDARVRAELAPCHFNQAMVTEAPCVVTVCADVHRFSKWCEQRDAEPAYDNFEWFLNAATDALLGTTLYTARDICRILHLPKGVIPLTTVVIGHPAEQPPLTDRLPLDAVVHYDRYKDYTDAEIDELWAEKEASPETAALLVENGLPNLAQIFTRNRYRREDNIAISRAYFELLREQGFFNQ